MYTEPEQNMFNFTEGDYFIDVAGKHNARVRCHNLVWVSQLSDFVTSTNWTAEALTQVMKNHILLTVQYFGRRCYSWDVVNEALNSDRTFSASVWYDAIGEDYFFLAYKYAQEALAEIGAGDVKLNYNDCGIENPGTKADTVLQLVSKLRKRGIRIDGIGLESHFIVGETPSLADQLYIKKALSRPTWMLLSPSSIFVFRRLRTTLQLFSSNKPADCYASVTSCIGAVPRCVGIVVWDFDDAYSWVPSTFAGQGGADLFNSSLQAKPAYYAVAEALEGKSCSVC
jgi:endo-1,4-beta-xylanase